jgi:hypothetical protein
VAIFRDKRKEAIARELELFVRAAPSEPPAHEPPERVADFSYTSDSLAAMIVDAWVDSAFKARLLDRNNAKQLLQERGFYLENPVVITEDQYNNHYKMRDENEVIFVLPNETRVAADDAPGEVDLLETAKLLMAITPNGI